MKNFFDYPKPASLNAVDVKISIQSTFFEDMLPSGSKHVSYWQGGNPKCFLGELD